MSAEKELVDDLRWLFKDGAMPSRLVRRILLNYSNEPLREQDRLIRAAFREAFGIPMFRASANLLNAPPEELAFAGYGADVIQQIVERRGEWDSKLSERCWMDAIPERVERSVPPQLASLDPDYRDLLLRSSDRGYRKSEILSRLVERLQEQVLALEQSKATPSEHATSRPPLAVAG